MPCLAPRPERGRTRAAKPASAMWMAMPEGTSWLSPGLSSSGASRQARRSSPADPGLAYCGSISRILGSRILTCSLRKLALRFLQHAGDVRQQLARLLQLGSAAERMPAARIVERNRVVVGAERLLREVGGDQRHALFQALGLGVALQLLALGGEADAERRVALRRDPGEDVRVLLEFERRRAAVYFLYFLIKRLFHSPIGDGRHRYEDVAAFDAGFHRVEHLPRAAHTHALDAGGRLQRDRSAHQRHARARLPCGARHPVAPLARARIGDDPPPVDAF